MRLRPAMPSDASDIHRVHERAFPTAAEADLVDQLVRAGDAVISIVAIEDRAIVGHVLLSRMNVTADGRALNALGLAPLAVVPEKTRHGIGSALVEAGIAEARQAGIDMIFVLGDGQFYGRFGFDPDAARPFASRYAGPHFQALVLNPAIGSLQGGTANYARAFDEL